MKTKDNINCKFKNNTVSFEGLIHFEDKSLQTWIDFIKIN